MFNSGLSDTYSEVLLCSCQINILVFLQRQNILTSSNKKFNWFTFHLHFLHSGNDVIFRFVCIYNKSCCSKPWPLSRNLHSHLQTYVDTDTRKVRWRQLAGSNPALLHPPLTREGTSEQGSVCWVGPLWTGRSLKEACGREGLLGRGSALVEVSEISWKAMQQSGFALCFQESTAEAAARRLTNARHVKKYY